MPKSGPNAQIALSRSAVMGLKLIVHYQKGEIMTLKKLAICAAALVAATIATQLAQAGGKGLSASSPGHITQSTTPDPPKGASTFAPGSKIEDGSTPRTGGASQIAPGDAKSDANKKK